MEYFKTTIQVIPLIGLLWLTGCSGLSTGLNRQPSRPGSIQQLSLARLQERQGDSAAAEKLYRRILRKQPAQPLARHRLGVIAAQAGDFNEALRQFETALNAGEQSAEFFNDFGYACYLAGNLNHAERMLRASLERDSRNPSAHNNLGLVLGAMRRDQESLAHFRQAGSYAEALNNMAWVHAQRGDLQSARKHYLKALDADQEIKNAAEALVALRHHNERLERLIRRERDLETELEKIQGVRAEIAAENRNDGGIRQASHRILRPIPDRSPLPRPELASENRDSHPPPGAARKPATASRVEQAGVIRISDRCSAATSTVFRTPSSPASRCDKHCRRSF